MSVGIDYELGDLEPHHREVLHAHEQAVRSLLEKSGRTGRFVWKAVQIGENLVFDLVDEWDRQVAQVTPLDLTLTLGEFERLLWEHAKPTAPSPSGRPAVE